MVEKTRHRKIPEIVSWSETVACKGANLRISYDAQNRRVYRKADEDQSGSQETELYYVLDGNRVIEERVYSDEDLKRDYWYGVYIDECVYARCDLNDDNDFSDTDEQFYYLHNTQYSVNAIIDTSGSIIEVYKNYQPYGAVDVYTGDGGDSDWWDGDETTGSLSSNYYLFTGRRYDPEADLMFYRNRMYSTSRGRFLQRDPVGYKDGLNLYRAYFVPGTTDSLGLGKLDQANEFLETLQEIRDELEEIQEDLEDVENVIDAIEGDVEAQEEILKEGVDAVIDRIVDTVGNANINKKVLEEALRIGHIIGSYLTDNLIAIHCKTACRRCEADDGRNNHQDGRFQVVDGITFECLKKGCDMFALCLITTGYSFGIVPRNRKVWTSCR